MFFVHRKFTCRGSSAVEQRPEKPCVGGSTLPPGTIKYRGLAQMARVLGLGPRGREFESRIPEVKIWAYSSVG